MKRFQVLLMLALLGFSFSSEAKNDKPSFQPKSEVSREFRFGAMDINGRYQSAGELNARVEKDKALLDLLAVRTNFKDRVRKEMKRK